MKFTWLRRIAGEFSNSKFVIAIYLNLNPLREYGGEYATILMLRSKNPFWKDILKYYKKLNYEVHNTNCWWVYAWKYTLQYFNIYKRKDG